MACCTDRTAEQLRALAARLKADKLPESKGVQELAAKLDRFTAKIKSRLAKRK